MIISKPATLARVKTMADNSIRIELDFGEYINLGDLDDLRNKVLNVYIVTEEQKLKLDK